MNKGIRKIYLFLLSLMLLVTVSGTVYAEVPASGLSGPAGQRIFGRSNRARGQGQTYAGNV